MKHLDAYIIEHKDESINEGKIWDWLKRTFGNVAKIMSDFLQMSPDEMSKYMRKDGFSIKFDNTVEDKVIGTLKDVKDSINAYMHKEIDLSNKNILTYTLLTTKFPNFYNLFVKKNNPLKMPGEISNKYADFNIRILSAKVSESSVSEYKNKMIPFAVFITDNSKEPVRLASDIGHMPFFEMINASNNLGNMIIAKTEEALHNYSGNKGATTIGKYKDKASYTAIKFRTGTNIMDLTTSDEIKKLAETNNAMEQLIKKCGPNLFYKGF